MHSSGTSGGNPLFCVFSSIIRDATFRFSSPFHPLFVTQHSDFLRSAFSSIIRDATFRFSLPSHQLFVTQHSNVLCLLINYSWRNIQIFFAFSSIIRDATFRFPSPSHQLFVTQQSDFSQLFVTLHSNFSSPHHGQVFMNYILIFLSFSSVIHDSTYVGITHVPATSLKLLCLTCVNCLKTLKLTITFAYLQIQGSVGPTKTVI